MPVLDIEISKAKTPVEVRFGLADDVILMCIKVKASEASEASEAIECQRNVIRGFFATTSR